MSRRCTREGVRWLRRITLDVLWPDPLRDRADLRAKSAAHPLDLDDGDAFRAMSPLPFPAEVPRG